MMMKPLKGITSGKVSAYITDFPTKTLIENPAVICTPHLGASTAESEENCAVMAVKQTKEYLEYGVVHNSVNFPTVELFPQQSTLTRLIIINKDVPNMIAQLTQVLGNAGLNIQSYTNESNGKIGYNIIDLDVELPNALVESLQKISNVVQVRVLRFAKH
jgi:D-3-phosphoglycerate dehydrogenase / 2-oxoglutarate reductase